jgi:hypothetical protein
MDPCGQHVRGREVRARALSATAVGRAAASSSENLSWFHPAGRRAEPPTAFEARWPALHGRLPALDVDPAPSATGPIPDHDRDLIFRGLEVLHIRSPELPRLQHLVCRFGELSKAPAPPPFDCLIGIDVLDVRMHQLQRSRKLVPRPRLVEAPHDFDVLGWHRYLTRLLTRRLRT